MSDNNKPTVRKALNTLVTQSDAVNGEYLYQNMYPEKKDVDWGEELWIKEVFGIVPRIDSFSPEVHNSILDSLNIYMRKKRFIPYYKKPVTLDTEKGRIYFGNMRFTEHLGTLKPKRLGRRGRIRIINMRRTKVIVYPSEEIMEDVKKSSARGIRVKNADIDIMRDYFPGNLNDVIPGLDPLTV